MTNKSTSHPPNITVLAAQLEDLIAKNIPAFAPSNLPPPTTELPRLTTQIRAKLIKLAAGSKRSTGPVDVSIIIPVFNKVEYSLRCLESLASHRTTYNYEVIVIDNASSDGTSGVIGAIAGIRYIKNRHNLGFVDACNQGAQLARGNMLVFLNNDTMVLDNWLDQLLQPLADDNIGLSGSKLIYPDGTLQEAGGILYSDGSGANYGKGQNSHDYEYNYVRDVDYCSGASVAIKRELFEELGGFDRLYAPAYYEDGDLAMKVRQAGKRVVYIPSSVIAHVEGGTSGTDTSTGFKRFQVINHKKFAKKWRKELASQHYKPGTNELIARNHGKKRRNLLIVDSIVPEHNRDAGSLRMAMLVEAAQKLNFNVSLFPDNRVATLPYTAEFQQQGVEVIYGKFSLKDFYKDRANMYDAIILSRPMTAAAHLDLCQAYMPQAKIIFDTVDLHFMRVGRRAKLDKDKLLQHEADLWQALELAIVDRCDTTVVVSEEEKAIIQKLRPKAKLDVISLINRPAYHPDQPKFGDRQGLLFVGSYSHTPNVDAALWFTKEVLPLIRKQLPDVPVHLLGSKPTTEIAQLQTDNLLVPGFIDDIAPYFDQNRIFICPLRYGAGVKGKLSQALSHGLPIVSTPLGIDGMHMQDGRDCLIATKAQDFAQQVIKLYNDEKLWNSLRQQELKTYTAYFSEEAGLKSLQHVLAKT